MLLIHPVGNDYVFVEHTAVKALIPGDALFPFFLHVLDNAVYKVALKLFGVPEMLVFDSLLTVGTLVPAILRCFVAADMEVFIREKLAHLIKKLKTKLERFLSSGAQDILMHARSCLHRNLLFAAGKRRIGRENRNRMARQINFGDYINKPFPAVFHDFFDLCLCIISAVTVGIR